MHRSTVLDGASPASRAGGPPAASSTATLSETSLSKMRANLAATAATAQVFEYFFFPRTMITGKRTHASDADHDSDAAEDSLGAIPDLLRKALGVGLSGFFLTEATIRKAVGDTIPKDWVDFAVDQSDRTRAELLERLSLEVGRSIENIDYVSVLERLMEGRTLEINARVRLGTRREADGATKIQVTLEDDEEAD